MSMGISITGLASGLDTASIVQDLMRLERIPLEKVKQTQTSITNYQSVFRSVNTKLSALRDQVNHLTLDSAFRQLGATSSNEQIARVTTNSGASVGSYQLEVERLASAHIVHSEPVSLDSENLLSGTFVFYADPEDPTSSKDYSARGETNREILENLKNDINADNLGFKASIIQTSDHEARLVLTADETGSSHAIGYIGENDTFPADGVKYHLGGNMFGELQQVKSKDELDAWFTINGIKVTSSSNQVENVIAGATIELSGAGSTSIKVDVDTEKITAEVDKFVKAYNDVVTNVRGLMAKGTDERPNPLQSDSTLRQISNELHNIFTSLVGDENGKSFMEEIGLSIDKGITKGNLMTGTITFDRDVFKQSLTSDSDKVSKLFASRDESSPGIATRLSNTLRDWTSTVDGLLTFKIKGYDSEISILNDRIEGMEYRLEMKESQLRSQFTAMEIALARLQSEQEWMTGQLAQLTAMSSQKR